MTRSKFQQWRRVVQEVPGKTIKHNQKLLGQYGLMRPNDHVLPPHFKHQSDKYTVMHVKCHRAITFDGYVRYSVRPYLKRIRDKTRSPFQAENWKEVLLKLDHQEIITLIYFLEKACDWCTRQKLMDHEWERQQQLKLKQVGESVEQAREEQEERENQIDEIIKDLSTADEADTDEPD